MLLWLRNRIGSIGTFDLWNEFDYDELTINIRQKKDKVYEETLANIRVGKCEETQLHYLNARKFGRDLRATPEEVSDLYLRLVNEEKYPVILMPTNDDCKLVNIILLQKNRLNLMTLTAIDQLSSVVKDKRIEEEAEKNVIRFEDDWIARLLWIKRRRWHSTYWWCIKESGVVHWGKSYAPKKYCCWQRIS